MQDRKSPLVSYDGHPAQYWIIRLERMEREHEANMEQWWDTDRGLWHHDDGSVERRKWFYEMDSVCECGCRDAQAHSEKTKELRAIVYPRASTRYLNAHTAGVLPDYEY